MQLKNSIHPPGKNLGSGSMTVPGQTLPIAACIGHVRSNLR